ERLHVPERCDGGATASDLTERQWVVRIAAHERRHVVGDRESGLALLEEEVEPLVRVLRRAEAGELAHRPQPSAIAGRLTAARVGILARQTDRVRVALTVVERRVQRLQRDAGGGRDIGVALRS